MYINNFSSNDGASLPISTVLEDSLGCLANAQGNRLSSAGGEGTERVLQGIDLSPPLKATLTADPEIVAVTGKVGLTRSTDEDASSDAKSVVDAALHRTIAGDAGAMYEEPVLQAIHWLAKNDQPPYQRYRKTLKAAGVSLRLLDAAVKRLKQEHGAVVETHYGYAMDVYRHLFVDNHAPVYDEGTLYVVEPATSMWVPMSFDDLVKLVPQLHDGKENCKRESDYTGISKQISRESNKAGFFDKAAVGLACRSSFYRLVGDTFITEPLTPLHRQRVQVSFDPEPQQIPRFAKFLDETFGPSGDEAASQQKRLVQEIAGAIMLGLMPMFQKAILFYDPIGRAGKGTLEQILRQLVPTAFVRAISPFRWNDQYYIADLAGARLNVVGELPDGQVIPDAEFKSLIGGDLVSGRPPCKMPMKFKNQAAHLFMSNHLINTRDSGEAFFARWLIVEFPNSRLKSGLPLDAGLAEEIIREELPGIAYWALHGAKRLLKNNAFTATCSHARLMKQWRFKTNSLMEFIQECCVLREGSSVKKTSFYEVYGAWCRDNGCKALSSKKVKELIENDLTMDLRLGSTGGIDYWRGICLADADQDLF